MFSVTTIMSAGHITIVDDRWITIQELSLGQAKDLADILAIATNEPACVKWVGVGRVEEIIAHPGDVVWNKL